jgi:pilus assembly protein FimV
LTFSGHFALTGVAAAALCLTAPTAWSLGLGRLQVQSSLGEAMRAEIDVTSLTPEEASNLRVRVAPPEAYRSAGVDYNNVLPGTRTELLRRADGSPYLKISSDRGVQEPFVDLILELNWSTGRLVREYTLLFDPPVATRTPPPTAAVAATSPVITAAPAPAPVPYLPVPAPAPVERRAAAPTPRATEAPAASPKPAPTIVDANDYKVRPGDSLSRVAGRTQRPGVSLDQMLVALYRGNPQAFVDNNMNRLRSGVVLSVPSAEVAAGVSPSEAHQVVQAQSADFGAYRQRLAAGVTAAPAQGSARQASGKVQANVDDRQQGTPTTPDKLTLSKGSAAGKTTAPEDRISTERAKKADDLRVAELSKNVDELKRLAGAANSTARPGAAAPAVPVPAVVPAPAPVPVAAAPKPPVPAPAIVNAPVPAPAPTPAPVPTIAPAPAPVTIAAPAVVPPVVTASAAAPTIIAPAASVVATAPPGPRPASAPAVKPRPAAPVEEPGILGSLLDDNPIALWIAGAVVLLLAGFGIYRFTKRPKKDSGETSFLESRLQPDSFFGASGGQRIDTRDAGGTSSSMSYSLSQLDAIGDVDPVAEADVYLAYGRDLQAEEILKEAMRSNPDRMAIRTKLLEVYAKRRDTKGFELLATQLFSLTRGEGEDWAKAQELGAQIDPDNPLFQPGGAPVAMHGNSGEMIEPLGASTMPQSVLPSPSQFNAAMSTQPGHPDSGMGHSPEIDNQPSDFGTSIMDLDLDLDDPDVGVSTSPGALEETQAFAAPSQHKLAEDPMSLDFSVPEVPELQSSAPPMVAEPTAFDLSDISLDLDMPSEVSSTVSGAHTVRDSGFGDMDLPAIDDGAELDPLSRKLELAEEFRQIGDNDGARDLLNEVVAKSSGAVKSRAQAMLADIG